MLNLNSSDELNQFKTNINLVEYAASLGYSIDNHESSRSNVVMRDDNNDKIIITQQSTTHHWIYWSDREQADKGTIIDFIQRRRRLSLGEVRKELRSWNGNVTPVSYVNPVVQSKPNLKLMLNAYNQTQPTSNHPYLINSRKIPLSTLHHPKFTNRIRIDPHKNAIFPHFDTGRVCGYEIKNFRFTGFSPHGLRGLWCSVWQPNYNRLIITESGIDALSFHALHGHENDFYLSIGGQLGKRQLSLIQRAITNISNDATLFVAFDNDVKGHQYASILQKVLHLIELTRLLPQAKDWNEDLQATA